MNRQLDYSTAGQNQMFVHHNKHLAFSTQQTTIKKVHSLRKVDTYHPTHTPEIH